MASFYIPLTGLTSDSTALNTIANDLANMNTTAFKSQSVNFSDLFYQQIGATGAGDPIQRGSGTQVSSIATDFTTGSPNATGVDTDVALQGEGFFVVGSGGSQYLTRAGNFSTDSSGNLITSNGMSVLGYPATNGVVNPNAALTPINIPKSASQPPKATSSFGMDATLNSQSPIGTSNFGQVKVYDSLGNWYEATVTYTKTANNVWSYNVTMPDQLTPNTSISGPTTTINYNFGSSGGTQATLNAGTNLTITGPTAGGSTATIVAPAIAVNESVSTYAANLTTAMAAAGITGVTATASPAGILTITGNNMSTTGSVIQDPVTAANNSGVLTFDAMGNLVSPATNIPGITFAGLSDSAATLQMTWDLYGAGGKPVISQVDQTFSGGSTTQDGYASGEYSGFSIGSDGTVTAAFSNGQKLNVGQLALGTVKNLQGLQNLGSGQYAPTLASGTATIGISGTEGLGTMNGGALEASNVNISAEFSNLIIAQRAFEANSKAVTTFDTVTQETINMIH
ncbi:MAG TPA: flagellar hook protein FlgE [Terracidiphilus sp.]|jgi:flagellar hook protein FlgE